MEDELEEIKDIIKLNWDDGARKYYAYLEDINKLINIKVKEGKEEAIEIIDGFKWDIDKRLYKGDKWGLEYAKQHNQELEELKSKLEKKENEL